MPPARHGAYDRPVSTPRALAAAVLTLGVLVPSATADARTTPRTDPAARSSPRTPYLQDTATPVPIPHALPHGPEPVPMPHTLPRGPKPVPMPLAGADRGELLLLPRR